MINGEWSIEEKNDLIDILSKTQNFMEARNAPELSEFLLYYVAALNQVNALPLHDDSLKSRLDTAIHTSKEYERQNKTNKIKIHNQHEL